MKYKKSCPFLRQLFLFFTRLLNFYMTLLRRTLVLLNAFWLKDKAGSLPYTFSLLLLALQYKSAMQSRKGGNDKHYQSQDYKMYFTLPDNGNGACNFCCFFYIGNNDIYISACRLHLAIVCTIPGCGIAPAL